MCGQTMSIDGGLRYLGAFYLTGIVIGVSFFMGPCSQYETVWSVSVVTRAYQYTRSSGS